MSEEITLVSAFATGAAITWVLTPAAIALARRTEFMDRPLDYKKHACPTPYLGGVAVMAGFLVTSALFGADVAGYGVLVGGVLLMHLIGTIDDRVQLGVGPRLGVQVFVAAAVWVLGYGWEPFSAPALNAALTTLWIVGIVNAFNLMDNLDGASGTVAATSGIGIGILAAIDGDPALGAACFALAGACVGFLPHNLARPSKIFMGDGGSTPVGFAIAFMVVALPGARPAAEMLFALAPLVGLVILDTTLVVFSRSRRGVHVLRGGRDHITHRLLRITGTPHRVALALFVVQAMLCVLAARLRLLTPGEIAAGSSLYVAIGAIVILGLEQEAPAPVAEEGRAQMHGPADRSTEGAVRG